jgi:hypothetical protein
MLEVRKKYLRYFLAGSGAIFFAGGGGATSGLNPVMRLLFIKLKLPPVVNRLLILLVLLITCQCVISLIINCL